MRMVPTLHQSTYPERVESFRNSAEPPLTPRVPLIVACRCGMNPTRGFGGMKLRSRSGACGTDATPSELLDGWGA